MSTSPAFPAATANPQPTRRGFLRTSTAAALGATMLGQLSVARSAHAAGSDVLKVGLIGCGGRGSGAAANSLNADPNVKLTALADVFEDRVAGALKNLTMQYGDRVDVPKERQFVGWDAYKQLIDSGVDIVLMGTSPHFRPAHLKYAIEQGKHVFAEKPVCVDAPGYRSILETTELARQKNLSIVSGLCWRYDYGVRETMKRVMDGAIGEIIAIREMYNARGLWHHGHDPKWSDMEYQMRNWLYFTWLSGDHIVEQACHSIDKMAWAMKDASPVKCVGVGGRQSRIDDKRFGHIFDHHAVVFEYKNGVKLFHSCRQQNGTKTETSDWVMGSEGTAEIIGQRSHVVKGKKPWTHRRRPTDKDDMYQNEHNELFASIRKGEPINDGEWMVNSTLMSIMGRTASYTGQEIIWDKMLKSKESLAPEKLAFGPLPAPVIARPGVAQG